MKTTASDVVLLDTAHDHGNCESIALLIDSWVCLLADSPLNISAVSSKPRKVLSKFYRSLLSRPLIETVKMYSRLGDRLASSTYLSTEGTTTSVFLPEFLDTPVAFEYLRWYKSRDPRLLVYLLSFLHFGKKMHYDDEEFNHAAFRGWIAVEKRLSDLQLPSDIIAGLRLIMKGLVSGFSEDIPHPRYGPGAVSEPEIRGTIQKSNNTLYDAKVDRMLFHNTLLSSERREELGFRLSYVIPDTDKWNKARTSCRISTLRFVPKDVTKARSICMEPNTFMFAQQMVRTWIESCISKGPARRFIDITDQSRNRALAQFGSYTGLIDTIDLSSASDSVSLELIKALFPNRVLYYLLATRTSKVRLPDDSVVDVKKFAPMGSALCFPIQSLVYTAIVIYAAIQRKLGLAVGASVPITSGYLADVSSTVSDLFRYDPDERSVGWARRFEPAAVYGDDICVDSELTPYVTSLLSSLGFEVNHSKSFTGSSAFRESCGGYYWNGEDVTFLRYKVKKLSRELDAEMVTSMVACANRAGDYGFANFRRLLIHRLLFGKLRNFRQINGRNSFIFTGNRALTYGLFSTNVRNTHLISRYNSDYQQDEYRCIMAKADKLRKARDFETLALESYLYQRWWSSRTGGDIVTGDFIHLQAPRYDTSGSRLGWIWSPSES